MAWCHRRTVPRPGQFRSLADGLLLPRPRSQRVGRCAAASHTPRIGEAIAVLLEAGQKEGAIRDDIDEADVLVLLGFLSRMSKAEATPRASHLLGVLLDGLRTRD
ncbi:SbtR family transcriptional regulator [Microbacterium maritypicum]|uniref:SbtR family transcriptional regulator n=1 Tax=Microbacterium maritypicum TaxID=33918 RepID=UPI003530B5BF